MERKGINRSGTDRREVRSAYMTVPTIVLNESSSAKCDAGVLSHSRSAGDLDRIALMDSAHASNGGKHGGNGGMAAQFSSSMADDIHELESRNHIGLYCSPRLPRRSGNGNHSETCALDSIQTGNGSSSLNACNLNCLDPGSRVGSSVSLNSEYTTRSVGLISNDSSSECSQQFTSHTLAMEGSLQRHSVLKRFYSSPEKDDDRLHQVAPVRRNSKSMGNMQGEVDSCVCFEFGSDSTTDEPFPPMDPVFPCDTPEAGAEGPAGFKPTSGNSESPTEQNLVTMVTGGSSLREGRIRKWLTEINEPDAKPNS